MNCIKYLFALILFIQLISCEEKFTPSQTYFNSDSSPVQESWNSTVVFSDSGNVKAVLTAGHISVYKKKMVTVIDSNAKVEFFKNGVLVSTLTGKSGIVDDKTKDIEIFDSVYVINNEGSELKTQKLKWTNSTQKVSSDVFVKIKTKDESVEGIGFESDQNLKNYRIFDVSGMFDK
ncbi:MAG: Lipopolysaccharide export system protein LptC [Ignavibacteria bacterium]|nr:Lipopolysaccharide export system protein LptC [Ignavibacteria bacterium]